MSLRTLLARTYVRLAGAAGLFAAALAVLVALLGPAAGGAPQARLALSPALRHAPDGWLQALKPAHHPVTPAEIMLQLGDGAATMTKAHARQAAPDVVEGALPAAPIPGFFAPGPSGPLPIIAADGRTPFEIYSRPFVSNGRPKVALVIGGLGLNARQTEAAITTLPPEVTLSFSPYADGLQGWIDRARAHGHEVLLEAPMEPVDFPGNDPGPYTLMADAPGPETVKRVEWILSRANGYMGLTNYLGSRFLTSEVAYQALASGLKSRGLGFIDDGAGRRLKGGGLPRASADRTIDSQLSRKAIDQQLLGLEAGALQHGQALGAGFAYPVTVATVAEWARQLAQRGYQLAPASALAKP